MLDKAWQWLKTRFQGGDKVSFAPTTRVRANPGLHNDFINRVLGFQPDEFVFISDITSLHDFGNEAYVAELQKRISQVYGVDVTDMNEGKLCEIFDRIAKKG